MVRVPSFALDPDLPLPSYAHPGDAGADLVARETVTLAPGGGRGVVPTGIAVAIPDGLRRLRAAPQRARALGTAITCLNTPGLIDAGYRDEVRVILVNTDPDEPYTVERGDRIAQLVVQAVEARAFDVVDELPASERGLGASAASGRSPVEVCTADAV